MTTFRASRSQSKSVLLKDRKRRTLLERRVLVGKRPGVKYIAVQRLDKLMAIGQKRSEAKAQAQARGESLFAFSDGKIHSFETRNRNGGTSSGSIPTSVFGSAAKGGSRWAPSAGASRPIRSKGLPCCGSCPAMRPCSKVSDTDR